MSVARGHHPSHPRPGRDGAIALSRSGRHEPAVAAFEARLRHHPHDAEACLDLAIALVAARRVADAASLLTLRCGEHAHDPAYLRLLGEVLIDDGQPGAAVGALLMAVELDPADAQARARLGLAVLAAGDDRRALAHCREAWHRSAGAEQAVALTTVLMTTGAYADALAVTTAALTAQPGLFGLLRNHAAALDGLGRHAEAIRIYRHNATINAHEPLAQLNLGMALLHDGQLGAEAWRLYERRHACGSGRFQPPGEAWDGGDPAGRTVLLYAEQGLGDTIQFIRYAPLLQARGARVVVRVQPALCTLLHGVPGVDAVVPAGGPLPPYDVHCSLLSLPCLFGTTLDTIPPPLAGLARPEPEPPGLLQVGLVWSGSQAYVEDRVRSIPAAEMAALSGTPGVQFHSLQYGAGPMAPIAGITDAMQDVADFSDTARVIAALDVVVAVDTSVAHLAATMDKPVWLLSRVRGCWRWMHSRHDTPWYPTMRIIRQTHAASWRSEIAEIHRALQVLARARRVTAQPC